MMTPDEIRRDWESAKNRRQQIKILAELNCTTQEDIVAKLKEAGVDGRCIRTYRTVKRKEDTMKGRPVEDEVLDKLEAEEHPVEVKLEPVTIEVAISNDPVNNPSHYTSGDIECIDAIRSALGAEQFKGFLKGNIMKYAWRADLKNGAEDYKKARFYLDRLIEEEEA